MVNLQHRSDTLVMELYRERYLVSDRNSYKSLNDHVPHASKDYKCASVSARRLADIENELTR
jgi:hypothetical protein